MPFPLRARWWGCDPLGATELAASHSGRAIRARNMTLLTRQVDVDPSRRQTVRCLQLALVTVGVYTLNTHVYGFIYG